MAALIYLSHFRCTFNRNLHELYKLFVRFLCCCVWATNIWKRRATRPKRCARRKSHRANWRRNNEAAATNRTAQESKTEWKQKLFYFSNLFLAVAPRRAAALPERETHTRTGRERARVCERTLLRESTVAATSAAATRQQQNACWRTHTVTAQTHTRRGHPCVTQPVRELVSWVRLRVETRQLVCVGRWERNVFTTNVADGAKCCRNKGVLI